MFICIQRLGNPVLYTPIPPKLLLLTCFNPKHYSFARSLLGGTSGNRFAGLIKWSTSVVLSRSGVAWSKSVSPHSRMDTSISSFKTANC
jgi:hypothetical protein